jgi:diaminopimelate decarboxylase
LKDLAPFERAFARMRDLVTALREQGLSVERLDLGGGLGAPYFNEADPPAPAEYAAMIERVFAGFDIRLAFEPGRMIAANAGVLISRVIRVQKRAERDILVLDAAMNDLMRPALYDSYHDVKPVRETAGDAPRQPYDIVGPICETGDTFARARPMAALGAGDLVAFVTAGAYCAVMGSMYNSRALAPEVLVRGDAFEIVRRRFDIEDQLALEHVPDWLA